MIVAKYPRYYKIHEHVFNNPKLSPTAKLLYGVVFRLANNGKSSSDGFCWASDKTLAKIMQLGEKQIDRLLKDLVAEKIITIEQTGGKTRRIFPADCE